MVETWRLDRALAGLVASDVPFFLKVDTQGAEMQVLLGASALMPRIVGIRTEMSFAPLYAGQSLFPDMYAYIVGLGFEPWGISPVLRDSRSGRMLQCDMVFACRHSLQR